MRVVKRMILDLVVVEGVTVDCLRVMGRQCVKAIVMMCIKNVYREHVRVSFVGRIVYHVVGVQAVVGHTKIIQIINKIALLKEEMFFLKGKRSFINCRIM